MSVDWMADMLVVKMVVMKVELMVGMKAVY